MAFIKDSNHLRIPIQYIEEATKHFSTLIGRGGYGHVYKGELSLSGILTVVAVKKLEIGNLSGQGLKEFLTEIQLLSRYKHHNLVSLVGFCEELNEKFLVYEYAERGSLDSYLKPTRTRCPLTWKQRINICVDAARGLDHLHNHVARHERVIHRDIKSGNILIDHNWKAMIADFGLSKIGRANEHDTFLITNACGTPGYCDPVYYRTWILTKKSDIYSFGVVLLEVLCGRLSFIKANNVNNEEQFLAPLAQRYYKEEKLNLIIDRELKNYMNSDSMKVFLEIVFQCLQDKRKRRPSMGLVLQELEKALTLLESEESSELLELEEALGLNKLVETLQGLAFAKRVKKNKRKNYFSPKAAALKIQLTFRACLFRKSQALRAFRELAIVNGKLNELMALSHKFYYGPLVAHDEEERLKCSEKFIVMLLTVDAIEGATIQVRASKRSMVVKLEAILDVVDPQPRCGKSLSMKRTFDMQNGVIQKGVVEGVTQVFAKKMEKNKRKQYFSPKAAAMKIQTTFSAYLLRKSQALRAFRELAIVQGMLKEFATLFHLLHFNRRAAHDNENSLKFYEKFIVMLLAIDAIKGATIQVRAIKRKMVYKLEAILNIMDPQPGCGKSQSLKRRKFDIQDGAIQNNVAEGATQVVRMRQQVSRSKTFQ